MPNNPHSPAARLAATKRAARMAPDAKLSRLPARCVISTRSPAPAKVTVCSPTISPARTLWKPMARRSRTPVTPSRPYTASRAKSRPSSAARISPSRKAVPDGASTLWRWCASNTSTSTSSPNARAAAAASLKTTLTPRLVLGATTMGVARAARSMAATPAASKPVVPITAGLRRAAQVSSLRRVASGVLKSTNTSNRSATDSMSPPTGTWRAPIPANSPASAPMQAESGRPRAAPRRRSSAAATAATNTRPMRPGTPDTATARAVTCRRRQKSA